MKILIALVMVAASLFLISPGDCGTPLPTLENAVTWGAPVAGLRLSISPAASSANEHDPAFYVTFENVGEQDLTLNLGFTVANGLNQYPEYVRLVLVDATGKSKFLASDEPPAIAGRVDDYVLPLRSGSLLAVKLTLKKFGDRLARQVPVKIAPGSYTLYATYTGQEPHYTQRNSGLHDIDLMHFWHGTAVSNRIAFVVKK